MICTSVEVADGVDPIGTPTERDGGTVSAVVAPRGMVVQRVGAWPEQIVTKSAQKHNQANTVFLGIFRHETDRKRNALDLFLQKMETVALLSARRGGTVAVTPTWGDWRKNATFTEKTGTSPVELESQERWTIL